MGDNEDFDNNGRDNKFIIKLKVLRFDLDGHFVAVVETCFDLNWIVGQNGQNDWDA